MYISKSSYGLCKYFRFFLNFLTSWKSWVKGQWHKKSLFQIFWGNFMICALRPKKRGNIFNFLKYWYLTKSTKDTQNWICLLFLVNKSWAEAVNRQSWTFETDYTQKLHLYPVSWHKQPPDDQTVKFWHQVS